MTKDIEERTMAIKAVNEQRGLQDDLDNHDAKAQAEQEAPRSSMSADDLVRVCSIPPERYRTDEQRLDIQRAQDIIDLVSNDHLLDSTEGHLAVLRGITLGRHMAAGQLADAHAHASRLLDALQPGLLKHDTLCGVIDQIDNVVVGIREAERRGGWDRGIKEAGDAIDELAAAWAKRPPLPSSNGTWPAAMTKFIRQIPCPFQAKDIEERGLGGSTPQLPHRGSPQSLEGVEELERRLRDLDAKRTPGPWHAPGGRHLIQQQHWYGLFVADCHMTDEAADNAAFIVALENALPTLLNTISSLRRERDEARAEIAELERELIEREARRQELLDFVQHETGTAWECQCGHHTYHAFNKECEECGRDFPFLNLLAFKLHASGTENEEYLARAARRLPATATNLSERRTGNTSGDGGELERKLPSEEDIARALKSNLWAHSDPEDPALGFVDDESIEIAARAVQSLCTDSLAAMRRERDEARAKLADAKREAVDASLRTRAWQEAFEQERAAILSERRTGEQDIDALRFDHDAEMGAAAIGLGGVSERRTGWDRAIKEAAEAAQATAKEWVNGDAATLMGKGFQHACSIAAENIRNLPCPFGEDGQ